MKTLQISEESYQFVKNFINEIDNQDNRGTRSPYFYVIQQKKRIYPACGGDAEGIVIDTDFYDEDEFEWLCERLEIPYDKNEDAYDLCERINKVYTDGDVYTLPYSYEWQEHDAANVFFTETGYKQHVELNQHNLGEYRSYVKYAFRNPEIQGLMKAIREIVFS